jgi:hypothetical protein
MGVMMMKYQLLGFAQRKGTIAVREADEMKIAQRFIAGTLCALSVQSAKRTAARHYASLFSRPLHGLSSFLGMTPSAEALGYYHSSAARTAQPYTWSHPESLCKTKLYIRFSIILSLCLISSSVFAKGSPDEIVLLRDHAKPVEVTDRELLKQFDPWSGQFIDWAKGLLAAPVDQSHVFEVFFYMKWPGRHSAYDRGELKMIYQIRYIRGLNGAPGYIYLPGKAEGFYSNNMGTIIRENDDGKWHKASTAWELFISRVTGKTRLGLRSNQDA